MKTFLTVGITLLGIAVITSCSDSSKQKDSEAQNTATQSSDVTTTPESADPMKNKGVGPVTELKLEPLDASLADKGKVIFEQKCSACHKAEEKYVGPAIKGLTQRRTPEWIMNMILNPEEMTKKDPQAKELFETYMTQMTFQNVSQDETRAILEYFRQIDSK